MRFIDHSGTTLPIKVRKACTTWEKLLSSEKHLITEALVALQKGLCAYCESSVRIGTSKNCHIEHFKPRSKDKTLIFEWTNLFLSCDGEGGSNAHCGHYKSGRDVTEIASPGNQSCESLFSYLFDGRIVPSSRLAEPDARKAQITIDALNLNCPALVTKRCGILREVLRSIQSMDEWSRIFFVESLLGPQQDGSLRSFHTALSQNVDLFR